MANLTTAFAAERPFWIGGREYRLRALSLQDYADLEAWMQETVINLARHATAGLPDSVTQTIMDAVGLPRLSSDFGGQFLATIDASLRMWWQHLRRAGSLMGPDAAAGLLSSMDELYRTQDCLSRLEQRERKVGEQDALEGTRGDMEPAIRLMANQHNWTADQVANLTPTQLLMYIQQDDGVQQDPRTGRKTVRVGTLAEALALTKKLKGQADGR